MTISIHILNTTVGRIPRHWNRASSFDELHWMLKHYMSRNGWAGEILTDNINTDEPILDIKGTVVKFYAFTEKVT